MTLKSSDSLKVKESVQTDIDTNQGASDAVVSGPTRRLSREMQILRDKSVVAKRLGAPAPENIRIKNQTYYFRWVAYRALGGQLYGKRKAQGFTDATKDDAEPMTVEITATDSEILYGDLKLMKLPYERYASAIKANMERAIQLQGRNARGNYLEGQGGKPISTDPFDDSTPNRKSVNTEPFSRGGVEMFTPSQSEIDQKMPLKGRDASG